MNALKIVTFPARVGFHFLSQTCPLIFTHPPLRGRRRSFWHQVRQRLPFIFTTLVLTLRSRYYAQVDKVYPPKYNADPKARDAHIDPSSSSNLDEDPPHIIGGDLKTPNQEAIAKDNPALYYYWVYLTELERDKSHEKGKATTKITDNDKKLVGSLIEVTCKMMKYVLCGA